MLCDQEVSFTSFVNNNLQSTKRIPFVSTLQQYYLNYPTHTHSVIMSDQNGTTVGGTENVNPSESVAAPKGKGKAIDYDPAPREVSMEEDDDSSDEETGAEEDVWMPTSPS